MVLEHLHTDALAGLFSKKIGDSIAEGIIVVDVILNEYEILSVSYILHEAIEFRTAIGKNLNTVMTIKMSMTKIMGQFYHPDLILREFCIIERMLLGT